MRRRKVIPESTEPAVDAGTTPSRPKRGKRPDAEAAEFYQIPLTTEEARAALAVLRALRTTLTEADDATFTDFDSGILTSAAERIANELPEFVIPRAERLAHELTAWLATRPEPEPAPFGRHGDEKPPFPIERNRRKLERALDRGLPAEIEYYVRSREEWTVRRVDIEDVFEDEDTWYLEGYCRLRRDHRLFRMDNIRAVRIPGEDAPDDIGSGSGEEDGEWDPFSDPDEKRVIPPPITPISSKRRGRRG
jgi:predicted DNA-binding transcriptional regulator YafY